MSALASIEARDKAGERTMVEIADGGLRAISPVDALLEIVGHLGAAISQTIPEDDQIIAAHVRQAHALATMLWRSQR